ncbi:DUF397 domain-containing protein [Actinomadura craniellae]|uniref:DUF397 domain-containing protein n=1 Tax=Actinomadura craniellae TaxID=2231787 RepID=UPI001F339854
MAATWRKASHSSSEGNCVEITAIAPVVAVRDSRDPDGPRLILAPGTWHALSERIKHGAHDLP